MMDLDKVSLWGSVLTELQLALSGANFQTWFRGKTAILNIENGVVEVGCASAYNKIWIEERYQGTIKEILDRVTGINTALTFSVSSQVQTQEKTRKKPKEALSVPLFEEDPGPSLQKSFKVAAVSQHYSFSNFIVGQSNQLAYAVGKAVADYPAGRYNPLLVYGGVGVGKTHLLQAIGQSFLIRNPDAKALYISSETFTNDMVEAIQKKQTIIFREKYRNLDLLLVDDVQFIAGRESTQEQFFHTFNELHAKSKQIVLSCDRDPSELSNLEERLKNRFVGGMVAKIDPPDLELREAILLAKAKRLGLSIEFPLIKLLAVQLGSSIRELEGALLRVAAVARLTNTKIDRETIKTAIGLQKQGKKTAAQVLERVASYFSLPVAVLKGTSRSREHVFPRQVAMYLLRKASNKSFYEIARRFNDKDHTTVIYSVNKVENMVENDTEIARIVEELKSGIFNN
ncbi:MAG: chromosomal replication initiator protein DnaA [Candidatus Woykebacteria bacterium]